MTNGTKLVIGILAIAAIGLGISTATKTENSKEIANNSKKDTSEMLQYMESPEKNKNNVVKNEVAKEVEDELQDEVQEEQEVQGKEEVESKKENIELNNEQKAIKLAQDEWAISISSYRFEADLQDDGTYIVRVINKTDTKENARYKVNVTEESIEEL